MLHLGTSVIEIIARTLVIYVVVVIGLRLIGKRELGQMTPFNLVLILLIANSVQNAMVGPDTSLVGGLIAVSVLLTANTVMSRFENCIPWITPGRGRHAHVAH
ncbi:MAG: hypothetical protein EXR67_04355 [Dehalococcoidia bacterium]|nr:hypothetical protein [Dehalococcoidia bacterium]